jgi:dUTP pyrophosphatase
LIIKFKKLSPHAQLPQYGSADSIGLDLFAISVDRTGKPYSTFLNSHERRSIKTGIAVEIPPGYYGRVAPRSGLAIDSGLDVLAGVIDPDYRGEIFVVLMNFANTRFFVRHGARIAQLILERADRMTPEWAERLASTYRDADGLGSTGV